VASIFYRTGKAVLVLVLVVEYHILVRLTSGSKTAGLVWVPKLSGVFMGTAVQLSDDDIAFLVSLLKNSSQPLTTQQLIQALRSRGR